MKEWENYINSVLYTPSPLDEITVEYDKCRSLFPPIIKASIYMLEQMIKESGRHNIFVFPEFSQLSHDFLLAKVLFNLLSGKIQMDYNPEKFRPGQKLKYKKAIMEFLRIDPDKDGNARIVVRFADLEYSVPLKLAPYLQITTADHLSKYKKFASEYSARKAIARAEKGTDIPSRETIPRILTDHRTHLDGSVFLVTQISSAKKFLSEVKINDQSLKDCLFLAQADGDGKLTNISSGQLSGNPAIVIVQDLYSLLNAIRAGAIVQSVIFDASTDKCIEKQLDAFDELNQYGFPVVCITETSHSFGLSVLTERGYNIWRWNESNLTDALSDHSFSFISGRIKNCRAHDIQFLDCDDSDIRELADILLKYKKLIPDLSPGVNTVFDTLLTQLFLLLRKIVPFSSEEASRIHNNLNKCAETLSHEKRYLNQELFDGLSKAIYLESSVISVLYANKKETQIKNILSQNRYSRVCVIIPEQHSKEQVKSNLQRFIIQKRIPTALSVMYPQEFQQNNTATFQSVIVSGWIGEKVMRILLYCHAAPQTRVLLYHCEKRWKNSHTKQWSHELDNTETEKIATTVFGQKLLSPIREDTIYDDDSSITIDADTDFENPDEYIRFNRVKKYCVSGTSKADQVEAFPVSLVGGFLAFYKGSHKFITVTEIITQNKERIMVKKLVAEKKTDNILRVGDFIVVRESGKDLIRSIADKILEKSEFPDARKISNRWRDALTIEGLFSTPSEIVDKIKAAGCPKDRVTILQWITNDERIIPQDIESLRYIALATSDDVLADTLDGVFAAGSFVKSMHAQAGQLLSKRLRMKIVEYLQQNESIDPYNFWEPLVFSIEDVGTVKILKVIDIGESVTVDTTNTNRLLID